MAGYGTLMIPFSVSGVRGKTGIPKGLQGAEMDRESTPERERAAVRSSVHVSLRLYRALHPLLILGMRRNNISTFLLECGSSFAPRT